MAAKPTPRQAAATSRAMREPVRTDRIAGRLLDARRDRLDLRDRAYMPRVRSLLDQFPEPKLLSRFLPRYVAAGLILDQGQEGACTGFGLSCVVNYLLWVKAGSPKRFPSVSPRMIYHLARLYDEWPGEDYDGSSCRGALKGWHKHGVCAEDLWPYRNAAGKEEFVEPRTGWNDDALTRPLGVYYRVDKNSIVEMQAAITEIGAIYVSSDVHSGWNLDETKKTMSFENLPVIAKARNAKADGGHAFALVGYDKRGFVVQNSWGPGWGLGGFALLPYEDWVEFGADAWASALGVPKEVARAGRQMAATPRIMQRHMQRATLASSIGVTVGRRAQSAEPRLTLDEAYRRTLVIGNDGRVERRIVEHADVADTIDKIGHAIPAQWFDDNRAGDRRERLVIYAHGGLNSEAASLERVRALGHCFQQNGIYPLFLTWKTGVQESIGGMLDDLLTELVGPARGIKDWLQHLKDSAIEAKDRALEVSARQVLVRALWDQMKQNAAMAAEPGRGGRRLAEALARLRAARGDRLEIHVVGHSAGAIILGHLLDHLPGAVASCTLFAPACTVGFANARYAAAATAGKLAKDGLRIHVLSDLLEQADSVGPYGKSLLYLVSRALERDHKTPILGLQLAFDPRHNGSAQWNTEDAAAEYERELVAWQKFWKGLPGAAADRLVVETRDNVGMGSAPGAGTTPAVHGCFDNHAGVIDATMATILGRAPPHPAENLNY
ncbi:MAG: C1 family peptidase [Alphaproteobacteria bacterium]|nr:C1 family peptidase [Alphaproteobacteria bacterium]